MRLVWPWACAGERVQLPEAVERCVQQVAAVKRAVAELRELAKNVVSHREKCCVILSAAMAASVALDQASLPTACKEGCWCWCHSVKPDSETLACS